MSSIVPPTPSDEPTSDRDAFVQGLRDLANWLTAHPTAPAPYGQRLLMPLSTNEAVAEFAAAHGLTVEHDAEGNASADLTFGPITYHVYGYLDFAAHYERIDERRARAWADRTGATITPANSEAGAR